ncbi:MAG: hypothetical protein ABW122_05070, partial [Ilumatobacteraceae bacterium]
MQATRLRLRFVSGASFPAATYGSGNYGSQTYGQSATDPLSALRYFVVPLPAGTPTNPSWLYRQRDSWPDLNARIMYGEGPLDLTSVAAATLVLTPIDGRTSPAWLSFALTMPDRPGGYVRRVWAVGDLIDAG